MSKHFSKQTKTEQNRLASPSDAKPAFPSLRFHIYIRAIQNRWQQLADGHVCVWVNTHTHTHTLSPPPAPLKHIIGSSSVTAVWLPVLRICSWSEHSPSALAWLPWCMHTQTLDNLSAFTYAASALHTTSDVWRMCARGECLCDLPSECAPECECVRAARCGGRRGEMAALAR